MDLEVVRDQAGVVTRRQLLAAGIPPGVIRQRVGAGRWQVLHAGVYVTFSGPVPPLAQIWGAVLRAGEGAAAGPRTSLWLAGAVDGPPARLDVLLPAERRLRGTHPFSVRRRLGLEGALHPAARPRRLRLEEAVLDIAARAARDVLVVDLVIGVVQRRLTTTDRLRDGLDARARHPRRALLLDLLAGVRDGVRSPLELRWLRDVERAHGLPASSLNRLDDDGGRRCYRDVEFLPWGLVVELDGFEAHPEARRFRDRRRDNRVIVSGRLTLRYGWHEVADDPCGVAAEVAGVLRSLGWGGQVRPCGPSCRAGA